MSSLYRSIAVATITFGASVVGMLLQWVVPADVLTASKGSVGAMVGLVTLLLALVLGLLVFTAFSVFTTQRDEAYSLGPMVAEVDLALELYGPEAAGGRAGLRGALQRSRTRFFGDSERGPQQFTFEEMRTIFLSQNSFFDRLEPETETQRGLLATARDQVRKLADTQMLMARHLAGAVSIGIAIFLILELSHPYTGLIRLSPEGIDRVLEILSQTEKKETPASYARYARDPSAFASHPRPRPGSDGVRDPYRREPCERTQSRHAHQRRGDGGGARRGSGLPDCLLVDGPRRQARRGVGRRDRAGWIAAAGRAADRRLGASDNGRCQPLCAVTGARVFRLDPRAPRHARPGLCRSGHGLSWARNTRGSSLSRGDKRGACGARFCPGGKGDPGRCGRRAIRRVGPFAGRSGGAVHRH